MANPKEFSPDTKDKVKRYARIGEAFADGGSCDSPSSAQAAVRLWTEQVAMNGEEVSQDQNHPPEKYRLRQAQAHANLYDAQARLLARKREAPLIEKPRAKRALFREDSKDEKENG